MRGSGFGYCTCFSLWRAGCALTGPRKRWRLGVGKAHRVGARDRAQFAASTRRCCQRTPGAWPRSRRTGVRRPPLWGGLLFGYFLLATQEKVTRSPKASESFALRSTNAPRSDVDKCEQQSHWVPACAGTTMWKFGRCRRASRLKALRRWTLSDSLAAGRRRWQAPG